MNKIVVKERELVTKNVEQIINQILYLVNKLNITVVPGFEEFNFKEVTKNSFETKGRFLCFLEKKSSV